MYRDRPQQPRRPRHDPFFRQGPQSTEPGPQHVPVNIYETDEDLVVVAPLPGVEATDVDLEVDGTVLTIRAQQRGPGQNARRYHVREWTYGPYERRIQLPVEVDASHANASHGNGVLVLSLPKASHSRAVRIPLKHAGAGHAGEQGHSGHHTTREGLPDPEGTPE